MRPVLEECNNWRKSLEMKSHLHKCRWFFLNKCRLFAFSWWKLGVTVSSELGGLLEEEQNGSELNPMLCFVMGECMLPI